MSSSTPRAPVQKEPLISPQADRALLKILVGYGGLFVVLFMLSPLLVAWFNIPSNPLFKVHRELDTIATFVIMVPFFLGINAMNNTRLKFARQHAEEQNWTAVYGAVETFSQLGQRWMDRDGEAHYLLSIAYERLGKKVEAEKARTFVTKYRPSGKWAAKLREVEASRSPRKISEIKADKGRAVKKLAKARRRF
jgi:hypothetical protein